MSRLPAESPRIYLMGMMGSGKSTLGRALAQTLGRRFVDLDELIEHRAGLSISEIFRRHGESHFRDLESAVLGEVSREPALVVALGGGTPTRPTNRGILRSSGCIVYLRTRPETLVKRLPDHDDRPLLRDASDPQATLAALLVQREPYYNEIADVTLDNETDTASALDRLIQELSRHGWISR